MQEDWKDIVRVKCMGRWEWKSELGVVWNCTTMRRCTHVMWFDDILIAQVRIKK